MLTLIHSDRAVMRKVLGGNLSAFRVLVDRYAGIVHGVAYARLRNFADAEDVAQETFIRFYQHLDQMAHRKHIGPWLVRVARNASVDLVRKRVRDAELREAQAPAALHVPNPVREEMHRMLWEQIDGLDPDAREVLVLHYFMKKKAREIAELLEITPDAAEKRVLRAREELGRRITDLLGAEIEEVKADAFREDRIMAAVVAAPAAWKACAAGAAAAATAVGVATGAGAAKFVAVAAVLVIAAVVGYLGYEHFSKPYSAQDITTASVFTVEDTAVEKASDATAEPKAADAPFEPTEADAGAAAASGGEEPVYPPVYGVIRGVVTTEDGAPAASAEVTLDNQQDVDHYARLKEAGVEDQEPVEPIMFRAVSDHAGRYEIEGVALPVDYSFSPSFMLRAKKGNLYGEMRPMVEHLQREMVIDLVLCPDLVVGGIVTDLEGKPIKKAFVATREQEGPSGIHRSISLRTKDDGTFLMEHMVPGKCKLYVSARGFLDYLSPWVVVGTMDNVFRLDPGNYVAGRVVERDTGRAVAGVYVSGAESWGSNSTGNWKYFDVKTDAAGNFKITGCVAGIYDLSVTPDRDAVLPYTLVEPLTLRIGNEPLTGLVLKTAMGGVLRGRIIDDETGYAPSGKYGVRDTRRNGRQCKVQPDGRYELIGLPAGTLDLEVRHRLGWNWIVRYKGSITLAEGEVRDNYDIHLPQVKYFSGSVVNEQGEAVPGVSVFAMGPGSTFPVGTALTDVSGRFRLLPREDAPTTLYFQAMNEWGYSAPAGPYRLGSPTGGIVLKLSQSGQLEGEVVDKQGEPVSNAVICATPDSTEQLLIYRRSSHIALDINQGKSINVLVEAGGAFRYPSLLPGRYTLHVYPFASVPGAPVAVTSVTVQAGRTVRAKLVVDMAGFGGIEGTVTLDGKPLSGQQIVIRPVSQKWLCHHLEQTDAAGYFEVRNILPGQVEVRLDTTYGSEKGFNKTQIAQIVSGEITRIDFDITAGHAAAEGYVLYQGSSVADVEVVFEPAGSPGAGGPSVRTGADGYYKVEDLPEGAYRVIATLTDYGAWPATKLSQTIDSELAADQTARIDFELVGGELAGTITGLKPGEKALIGAFPPDTVFAEWSVEAIEALGERMVRSTTVERDGPFSLTGMQEGDYIVGAVTLPAEGNVDPQTILEGRLAVGPVVRVVAGSTAEIGLVFENR